MKKSDLILDYSPLNAATPSHSPFHSESIVDGFSVISSSLDKSSYSTIVCEDIWASGTEKRRALLHLLAELIFRHAVISRPKSVLVVGLGSPSITSDSLGPLATARIMANPEVSSSPPMPRVAVISPGVPAKSGIDTADIVRALANEVKAELILTVDSLCAGSPERLCRVIQITDIGITPGSALAHSSGEISGASMPCPVVSVGVPTVIRGETLSEDIAVKNLLVSPANADIILDCYASIVSGAVNSFLLEILRRE